MKKVILIIILIVLIIGVSYIKSVRSVSNQKEAYHQGQVDAGNEIVTYQSRIDSLKIKIGEKEVAFADSITKTVQDYQGQISELEQTSDAQSDSIHALTKKLASPPKTNTTTSSSRKISDTTNSKHKEIIAYYKKRYEKLPGDLSDYERRIALNEIKEETAQKFSISLTELKEIREQYKLNY